MHKTARCWLAPLAALILTRAAAADTHAVVSSTRVYQDQETTVTFDYWIGADRSFRGTPGHAIITRRDLGVVWSVDLRAGTYTAAVIDQPGAAAAAPGKPDMRKLWLDTYRPDYTWKIRDTGETKSWNGYACRLFEAAGEADFSEITARYWISLDAGVPGAAALHDYSLSQFREDPRTAGLVRILDEHPGAFCVFREEVVEPSIAPTVRTRTALVGLTEAAAPPGTYDLPAGVKKIASDGGDR